MYPTSLIYVYILRCADNSIYIGKTHQIEASLVMHFNKEVPDTAFRLPVNLELFIGIRHQWKASSLIRFLNTRIGWLLINRL